MLSPMRPLGWAETLLKLAAFAVMFYFFFQGLPLGELSFSRGAINTLRSAAAMLLTLLLLVAIYDRFLDKEIFALIFILINVLAHSCFVLLSLAAQHTDGLAIFAGLMLVADLVKLVSIKLYDMKVRDIPQSVLYLLTAVFIICDALMLLPVLISLWLLNLVANAGQKVTLS